MESVAKNVADVSPQPCSAADVVPAATEPDDMGLWPAEQITRTIAADGWWLRWSRKDAQGRWRYELAPVVTFAQIEGRDGRRVEALVPQWGGPVLQTATERTSVDPENLELVHRDQHVCRCSHPLVDPHPPDPDQPATPWCRRCSGFVPPMGCGE